MNLIERVAVIKVDCVKVNIYFVCLINPGKHGERECANDVDTESIQKKKEDAACFEVAAEVEKKAGKNKS